jgi:hypothetical protein
MIEPEIMLAWLDKRIASATMWLSDFGSGKKARPSHEVEDKKFDIQALREIRVAYQKAVDRRNQQEK